VIGVAAIAVAWPGPVTMLEHYPASEARGGEHLDQVGPTGGRQDWRRIWPVPSANSDLRLTAWIHAWGHALISDRPPHHILGPPTSAGPETRSRQARWRPGNRDPAASIPARPRPGLRLGPRCAAEPGLQPPKQPRPGPLGPPGPARGPPGPGP